MNQKASGTTGPTQPFGWHALDAASVLDKLGSDGRNGLSAVQVRRRLRRYGANLPAPLEAKPAFGWQNLNAPMLILLVAGGAGLFLFGDWTGGAALLALPLVNLTVHWLYSLKSERHRRRLRRRLLSPGLAVREGRAAAVHPAQLVPGDLLAFDSGACIWADARVIEDEGVMADESFFDGPLRVAKSAAPIDIETDRSAQSSMLWCGTTIVAGSGRAVVVATGPGTFWSRTLSPAPLHPRSAGLTGTLAVLLGLWWMRGWLPTPVAGIVPVLMVLAMGVDRWAYHRAENGLLNALERRFDKGASIQ